ncbi:polysaccharide biosynthesis C-terminal domain-containing protein [Ruminococcus sp. XPD3002]|uniref:lipid II flippase MurJ n=1 Tax=Ruminococcus sp. XPD3002 TaxID=1452269 RepID=UPI000913BF1E|nr:Membrane protein involved in the export of O-antigen and teichoic acid [Ruminococcus flavefaciens]
MNKYKKLALNTMVFAVGSFGSKILVLLLNRLYTHYLSADASGIKELLEPTALFLQPIFTFALQEYLIRFGLDKNYDKRKVFTTSGIITFSGMAIMTLIVPLLSFIPALNYLKGYTLLLIVYVITSSFRMLCQQFVRARDMVKLFSLDGILATLTLLIFNLIFIAGLHMGVKGFMLAVILSDLGSSLFLFIVARLHEYTDIRCFDKELGKEMMYFAGPLIPTIVMWTITSLSDRMFINSMHSDYHELGTGAVGIYGYANKIPNLISMVSTIFFQAWNMSAITENDSKDRSEFYEKVYSAYESMLFIASAGLLLLIKPVTAVFVDSSQYSEYGDVYIYTPILVIAVLFMSLNQFLGSIYSATKHTKNSFWTALIACSVNLVMNFFLIPEWGIQGAAAATFLSYFICFWSRIIDARYYVPFRFNGLSSLLNTGLLFVMCWVIIAKVPFGIVISLIITGIILFLNYKAMLTTAQKLLRRG